eukprot:153300_1
MFNIMLQDTANGAIHSFPIKNIKENHMLNVQTDDKLFTNNTKKEEIEKQQKALLAQIDLLNRKNKTLQNGIIHKLNSMIKSDMNNKDSQKRIVALSVLWTQILKEMKQLKMKHVQMNHWKQTAIDNAIENKLLKQQLSKLKLTEQKEKDNTIRELQSKLNKIIEKVDKKSISVKQKNKNKKDTIHLTKVRKPKQKRKSQDTQRKDTLQTKGIMDHLRSRSYSPSFKNNKKKLIKLVKIIKKKK